MKPNNTPIALAAGVVLILVAGFFAGRILHPDPTPGYEFDLSAAVYEPTTPKPGLSKGGFSGFGETQGLPGSTLLSGKVTSVSAQEIVIEAPDGTKSSLRLANPAGVSRIEAAARSALTSGVTVVVRHADGSDQAEAVLIVGTP